VSSGFLTLSSLAVDTQSRRVLWADSGLQQIESVGYDGSARRSVVTEHLQEPSAVAVIGQHVYWVDKHAKMVERADKETGRERLIVKTRLTQLTDIAAVLRHDASCVNVCGRLHCSHLCVIESGGTARCSCPVGMSLAADSLTCRHILPDCAGDQVRCSDGGACVPRCDGVGDCHDMVDEVGCYGSCLFSEFQCLSGGTRCVLMSVRCDGRADCDDASDEARCERCVRSGAMLCSADSRCIGHESLCDKHQDCSDGEDERHCLFDASSEPQHTMFVVVGSVCGLLLLLVFVALIGLFWRRLRASLNDNVSAMSSKPGSVSRHAMITAVSLPSCRDASSYHSPMYDRVLPSCTSTSSSSGCTSVSSVPLYPRETLNPPPTPCTIEYSASGRHRDVMTPCSTDVCDDLDSATAISRWQVYSPASVDYETEPLYRPPPPTPHCRHTDRRDCDDDDDRTSSLGCDATTSLTKYSYSDCERHQHSVTRATSPQSCMS